MSTKTILKKLTKLKSILTQLKNCGTGAGGFKPGNNCAGGGGGSYDAAASWSKEVGKTAAGRAFAKSAPNFIGDGPALEAINQWGATSGWFQKSNGQVSYESSRMGSKNSEFVKQFEVFGSALETAGWLKDGKHSYSHTSGHKATLHQEQFANRNFKSKVSILLNPVK